MSVDGASGRTLLITGLGLMGGSLAAAAHQAGWRVLLHHHRPSVAEEAAGRGWGRAVGSFAEATTAELAVVCTPVGVIADTVRAIAADIGAVITDVGSTKDTLCRDLADLGGRFIGSHPMCGSHRQGLAHADADLYRDRVTIVTPCGDPPGLPLVEALWRTVGSRVLRLSPATHDRVVAEASHVPHVLASLTASLLGDEAAPVAASGFRDATRIAAGSPELWRDILLTNRSAVGALLVRGRGRLEELERLLDAGDGDGIAAWLGEGRAGRARFDRLNEH